MAGEALHLLLAGGTCGNTLNLIAARLEELLREDWDVPARITIQNVWQHHGPPPHTDLVLQTMQVYRQADIGLPVLSVRPMIRDREDPETLAAVREAVLAVHRDPAAEASPAAR